MTDYVELRCQSAFSFLRAASLPEDLVAEAARLGHSTLALGDRDGVYGAPRFFQAAKRAGIRPLVGAEVVVSDGDVPPKEERPGTRMRGGDGGSALYLLVESRRGYRNLCRMLTAAKLRAGRKGEGRVGWDDLEAASDGLVCLAGGAGGPLAVARRRGQGAALAALWKLRWLFGERLAIDVGRHLDPEEERLDRFLVDLAAATRTPLVATGDVRHARVENRPLLDVLTCIREKTTLDAAGRGLLPNAERHLRRPEESVALFADLPAAVRRTRWVAERCAFTLSDLGYRFPTYPLERGETPHGKLRALAFEGARRRWKPLTARIRRQLEHELAIIERLDLAGYFLIVWDIVEFCRREGILVQGRGSAANSAVCYALGITAVDAVRMDLLFERFLSEEREEWPDIDIDLPSGARREKVIQYVYRRYGPHGAAMTANVITYRARSAAREVGKALGFPPAEIDRLSKCLRAHGYRDDFDRLAAQVRAAGLDPDAPRVRHLVRLCDEIEALPRHLGQHSGGMVIAAGRLDEIVPLEPAAMPGRVVVQWDKDDCADLGIVKVDLLGLGMMAVLEDALPLVRTHEGVDLDLARLPQDDPAVYAALQRADTIGVFQVESRAQMATLPRMRPEHFYDLVVEVAIIRPGPIVGQMVHPYLARRAGREPVAYDHPVLEPILARTLGVPLFQEQLLRMAMALAGFSPGEAEELRRAMGFKRSAERMAAIEARLVRGMAERGITGAVQEKIVRSITSFALYGFPESHAASFALLAYASAYLKVHHPAAFLCAMLNNWPLGFYHPATLVKDAQRHGVRVLPIDVARSGWLCTLEAGGEKGSAPIFSDGTVTTSAAEPKMGADPFSPPAVRLGLRWVKELREETGRTIERERGAGPFRSPADLVRRTGVRHDELERLAHAGALACFDLTRRGALWQVAALETDRRSLFAGIPPRPEISPLPEMSPVERTLADYRATGITTGPHLLKHLRPALAERGIVPARELRGARNGVTVRVAGHVIVRQRPGTAKGLLFLTLEDETGTANVVVLPDVFESHRALLHTAPVLVVEGPIQNVDGVVHVRGRSFEPVAVGGEAPPSHDFH